MKNGICPKCGYHNVYAGTDIFMKHGGFGSNTIPISAWTSSAALDNYVCVDCGYVESYIAQPEKLRKISEKWPRVEVAVQPLVEPDKEDRAG